MLSDYLCCCIVVPIRYLCRDLVDSYLNSGANQFAGFCTQHLASFFDDAQLHSLVIGGTTSDIF